MTVHVVSNDVTVANRWVRQRCVWCGMVLVDVDALTIAVTQDDRDRLLADDPVALAKLVPVWPTGRLVDVDTSGDVQTFTLLDVTDRYPEDACMAVDPSVTA